MLDHKFNFDKDDILVYLHMQKTGGTTFGRHLVDNLRRCIKIKGYKRRECQRDLSNTLKNPREKLDLRTSNNRDVWILSRLSTGWLCGLHADYTEFENCINVTLSDFNKCPYNLASNRQTRMLGDLEFDNIDCYNNIFPIDLKSPTYHYAMRKLLAS